MSQTLRDAVVDPVFGSMVMGLEVGLPGAWRAADADREPLWEIAQREMVRGREAQDSRACRRAASAFTDAAESRPPEARAEMYLRAKEATAWALQFEGEYLTAGRQFEDIGFVKEAWDAYVAGRAWAPAQALNAPTATAEERDIVRFLAAAPTDVDAIIRVAESSGRQLSSDERLDGTFLRGHAQDEIEDRIRRLLVDAPIAECSRLTAPLRKIVRHVRPSLRALMGELNFTIGDMAEAVRMYEGIRQLTAVQKTHQAEAKARQRGFPDGLDVLLNAGHHQKVIDIWREYSSPQDEPWLRRVENSLAAERCFEDLLAVALERRDVLRALENYRKVRNQERRAKAAMYAEKLVDLVRCDFSMYAEIPELVVDVEETISAEKASALSESVIRQALDMWARPRKHGRAGATPFDGNLSNSVGFGDQQRSAFGTVLTKYQPEPMGRQLDPRWLGVAWELAEEWDSALAHYNLYAERPEPRDIMLFARHGIVRVSRRRRSRSASRRQRSFDPDSAQKGEAEEKEVATKWDVDISQAMRINLDPELVPFHVQATALGEIASGGEFGPFSWTPKGERIRLNYDGEVSRSWSISAKERTVTGHEGPMGRSRDGAFRTEVAGWAIEIRVNSQETVIDLAAKTSDEERQRHRARIPHGLR